MDVHMFSIQIFNCRAIHTHCMYVFASLYYYVHPFNHFSPQSSYESLPQHSHVDNGYV
jgi:hypothetical protein